MSAQPPDQTVDELEEIFINSDDPALTATEVASELDITRQGAHKKLMNAYEDGIVTRKKVGSRAVVWWLDGYSSNDSP